MKIALELVQAKAREVFGDGNYSIEPATGVRGLRGEVRFRAMGCSMTLGLVSAWVVLWMLSHPEHKSAGIAGSLP